MLTVLSVPAEAAGLAGHVEEDHSSEKCRDGAGQSGRVHPSSSWTLHRCCEHGSGHGPAGPWAAIPRDSGRPAAVGTAGRSQSRYS